MQELTANVNWIAVAVGTIASFLLGALWYSPIGFGKKWASGSRVSLEDADKVPAMAMVIPNTLNWPVFDRFSLRRG